MPRYTYLCDDHGPFDEYHSMSTTTPQWACPHGDIEHLAPKVLSGALQFTYGREDFHGPTIGERFKQQIKDCEADGKGYEPVGQRWV